MVSLEDIKQDLPTWPDEVIDQWLLNLAHRPDLGWPPPNPFGFSSWKYILSGKPIAWWRNVDWHLQTVNCSLENLAAGTKQIIAEMSAAHVDGVANVYSGMSDSRDRFQRALQYVVRQGVFPRALIAMRIGSGLSILDGNHRITAHHVSQQANDELLARYRAQRPSVEQQLWIGTHRDGEVLED